MGVRILSVQEGLYDMVVLLKGSLGVSVGAAGAGMRKSTVQIDKPGETLV